MSYHWARADSPAAPRIEGLRTPLPVALNPGASREFTFAVRRPDEGGDWRLEATLVQEFVCWFDEVSPAARAVATVQVENALVRVSD